jgi:DNA-binding winged helix-turn-helix (wHTH) protein
MMLTRMPTVHGGVGPRSQPVSHAESQVEVNETSNRPALYRLGQWNVDAGACQVSRGGETTKVEPRAMAVLHYLVANAGRTVSRDELLDEIWHTRNVVEEALTKCISHLRQALGDDVRHPTYIETVPKLGYRLLVEPKPSASMARNPGSYVSAWASFAAATPKPRERSAKVAGRAWTEQRRFLVGVIVVLVLTALAVIGASYVLINWAAPHR